MNLTFPHKCLCLVLQIDFETKFTFDDLYVYAVMHTVCLKMLQEIGKLLPNWGNRSTLAQNGF